MSTAHEQWVRRRPTPDEVRSDTVLAVGAFCLGILALLLFRVIGFYEEPAGPAVSLMCIALGTLPLALRRRCPSVVAVVISAAMVLIGELQVPETLMINISLFLALYTVGAWSRDRRRAAAVQWSVIAVMMIWLLSAFFRETLAQDADGDLMAGEMTPTLAYWLWQLLVNVLYFAGAVWFGQHSWGRARAEAQLEEQAEQLWAERATVAAQAVSLERLRIARELHDSVAHHVSLMGVQAGAARSLLKKDTDTAENFIRQIEGSARSSVQEMQSILGLLRDGDGREEEAASSLGVERIEELLDTARASGLRLRFEVFGSPQPLRPVHSLSLYRIAQEALTNIRKHAGAGAEADVRLRWRRSSVELEVRDDGGGRRSHAAHRSEGHGLPGMRERIAALGGTFTSGPQDPAGFLIRAELPLDPVDAGQPAGRDGSAG